MFSGRSKELFETKRIIFEDREVSPINILVITGEPGIGKTSLAHELYKYSSEFDFDCRVASSVHGKKWTTILPELARGLQIDISSKANESEIENAILLRARERPVLLVMDNIVEFEPKLIDFMNRWATLKRSRLLITTNEYFSKENAPTNCAFYLLSGITEEFVIRDLLGDPLVASINECNMWNEIEKLNGNPQQLLYLRWRTPRSCAEMEKCIADLVAAETPGEPLETVLQRIKLPVDHFLALARVRVPEIDEALLTHLWDQLALGTTEHYNRSLQNLLDEKLLESIDPEKLRLSALVHVQLQKPLLKAFGKEQIGFIDYFIGEYHRQLFSRNKEKGDYRLKDLECYVYHMIESGNIDSAYAYVFEGDELEAAHSQGLSIELESILHHFDHKLEALLKQASSESIKTKDADSTLARRVIMAANTKVELGRVHKDLSRHDLSLETMEGAKLLLDSISTKDDNARLIHELQTRIDHFRGIAYSQIGRTLECVEAYFESIKRSRQANSFGAVDALSLGYLAYELKFYSMDQSLKFAHQAVEFSRQIRNRNILVKNLCSLGQIQSFAGKLEESKASFTEAQQLCYEEPPDLRELGRILVNSAVTYISDRLWDQASERLINADKLFGESGDRRRKFMAKAYQGIMFYHIGQRNDALALMRGAFEAHLAIGAKRETLYEALTLVWMHNNGNMPKTDQMSSWDGSPSDIIAYLRDNVNADLDIFVRFWRHSYVPTLLTLGGSDVSPVNLR